ncbi:MAG: hypothetical protein JW808_03855 [Victivallales bacterium]|nr:hypothetical protein [Victivallales bacterium]
MSDKGISDCRTFRSLLPDYEWLDTDSRKFIDRHAGYCTECRQIKEIILDQESPSVFAPTELPDLRSSIMAELKGQSPAPSPKVSYDTRVYTLMAGLQIAAILIFAFDTVAKGADLLYDIVHVVFEMLSGFASKTLTLVESELSGLPDVSSLPDVSTILIASMLFAATTMLFVKARESYHL